MNDTMENALSYDEIREPKGVFTQARCYDEVVRDGQG
jgi:hypothetical protein